MNKKISLTGIKPSGTPHIGNYLGAIKPALELAKQYDARYFIADYHALNTIKDPETLRNLIYELAAAWLACGLDPEKVFFYKQSSVPEIFTLSTFLMAFTAKGLMNRAHAYKAAVADNRENGKDPDKGINMGLFTYPVLMAADILMFDTDFVPVGKDQVQHVEMAVDIAQAVNHNYGKELIRVPKVYITKETEVITGLDGRKMSKSYDNVIPIFLGGKKLRKLIMKIVTDSKGLEEPKDPDTCNVFALYKVFATKEQADALRQRYLAGGMGYGHAKQELYELLDGYFAPYREKYESIINDRPYIDKMLAIGAERARDYASKKIDLINKTIGIA